MLVIIIILIILLIYLLKNNISIISMLKSNLKEHFLITVKDRQKIGTSELEDGVQPKSSKKVGNMNYESCYSTETRNGNTTGRNNTYYCNQGIDGGEVIPAEGLYSLDFSNYTTHPGKKMRGKPLTGYHQTSNGSYYSLNNDGSVNGQTLTLAQSKSFCDYLKDKCEGFFMVIPTKDNNQPSKTLFIAKKEEGWEDPDTYSKKQQDDIFNTNVISYVKKDVNAVEKAINQDKINKNVDKYKNLSTCNWKSANRCIFNSYKYNQSSNNCETNEGLAYDVSKINDYDQNSLSQWLKQLYKEDKGVNKLDSEAMNVNNYVERCKEIDGYEFLSNLNVPVPYTPINPGNVRGRYVRITINNTNVSNNLLSFAEVQVINNNRNIAKGKTTGSTNGSVSANRATDSNNDGDFNQNSVFLSNTSEGPQHWEVDVGDANQTIDGIIISKRTDSNIGQIDNWLVSIHDYNNTMIWAKIISDTNMNNPKVIIYPSQSNNDINNVNVTDYKASEFNRSFYRVGSTNYRQKQRSNGNHYSACVQDVSYGGSRKKWVGGDMPCRDYNPGEWEEEERQRLERERIERERQAAIAAEAARQAAIAAAAEAERQRQAAAAAAHEHWLNTRCGAGRRRADRCSSGCERSKRWWERCNGWGCCT